MQEIDLGKGVLPQAQDNPISGDYPNTPEESVATPEVSQPSNKDGNSDGKEEKYTPREKQLFERAKKAEARLKEKGIDLDEPKVQQNRDSSNPFSLAKSVAVLKDFDASEIDFAEKIARMDNTTPEQAVNTPEFKTWLKGKRDEDLKANRVPAPNSSSSSYGLPNSEEVGKMTKEQHAKFEKDYLAKNRNKGSGF